MNVWRNEWFRQIRSIFCPRQVRINALDTRVELLHWSIYRVTKVHRRLVYGGHVYDNSNNNRQKMDLKPLQVPYCHADNETK